MIHSCQGAHQEFKSIKDTLSLQRHSQLSTSGGSPSADSLLSVFTLRRGDTHARESLSPSNRGCQASCRHITHVPYSGVMQTPHKGNVCPDGAPGSRATSFWSQTTTTLSGGAAKGPR